MYNSIVQGMDACEFLRIIIVPTAERIPQTIDDCKFSCQNKCNTIQRMDECHSYCDNKRSILQGSDGCN